MGESIKLIEKSRTSLFFNCSPYINESEEEKPKGMRQYHI